MRRLYVLFMAVALFYSCEKERKQKDPSDCELQMKERFKEDLKCTEKHVMEEVKWNVSRTTSIYNI